MKRSAACLQFLSGAAVAIDTAVMSSRPSYRAGRKQGQRGLSDRPYNGGRGQQLVTGDSHFRSVQNANLGVQYRGGRKQWQRGLSDRPYNGGRGQQIVTGESHFLSVQNSNLGIRQAGGGGVNPRPQFYNQNQQFPGPPSYNLNQQFRQPPPFIQNQNHQFRQAPPIDQAFRPPQQLRPRSPKPLDYRHWEYAKTAPPPDSEKFIVLSYNILADYLAIDHRSKLYSHIPHHILDWEWRKNRILFELGLWSADIICLQEIDRFQDIEEELRLRGYYGIWKKRTGNAFDGCAIFWRTSRFKLLYEESIEFNKLGLRDNVAQISVLEQLMNKNCTANASSPSTSSAGSNKVVICNIHVLYNPKRGEIKLGQVRTLLDRACAVSKMWNAPVVLCGDFNCTPKSPLYNFISEQKLDLSGIDRDKVSGQASAQLCAPRPNNMNYNPNPNLRARSSDNSLQSPRMEDHKLGHFVSDMQKHSNSGKSEKNDPSSNDHCQPQYARTVLDVSDMACKVMLPHVIEEIKETQQDVIDSCEEGSESTISALVDSFDKNLTIPHRESELPVGQLNEQIHGSTATVTSQSEDTSPDENEMEQTNSSLSNEDFITEHSHSNIMENKGTDFSDLTQSLGVSASESSGYTSTWPTFNDENNDFSAPWQVNISGVFTSNYEGDKKLEGSSAHGQNDFQLKDGMIGEDQSKFLSALHDTEDSFGLEFGQIEQSDFVHSQNEFASDPNDSVMHSPSSEVLDDFSLDLNSEAATAGKTMYDPSIWTPMEIATATGNVDCNSLEHPLKLKSTYTEVEDCSGTRDPNGEPLVTSYNRCFLGTVDYIWCSEGLQTVRALAPIPKHAMQWTRGYPTKKWGSDHIALASELAFTKDSVDNNIEAQ